MRESIISRISKGRIEGSVLRKRVISRSISEVFNEGQDNRGLY